jgi:sporulation protein YlmC with PRC-barrel domain
MRTTMTAGAGASAVALLLLAAAGTTALAQQATPGLAPNAPNAPPSAVPESGAPGVLVPGAPVPGGSTAPGGVTTGANAPAGAPMSNPLAQEDVTRITGTTVYGKDGRALGSVDAVLMKPESRTIDRLVVKSGGVLGVGGRDVAIPLDQFSWETDKGGFTMATTVDDLKAMPEWQNPAARPATARPAAAGPPAPSGGSTDDGRSGGTASGSSTPPSK